MLPPVVGGISFILFVYGIIQKFVLFPIYLQRLNPADSLYAETIFLRIKTGRIYTLFRMPTLYAIVCSVLVLFILHYFIKARGYKEKIPWGLLLVLGVFNLILTQSFGSIVYLSVGILIYLLLSGVLNFRYLAPLMMVSFLVLSIIIALRYPEAKNLTPVKLRLSNWEQAVRMIDSAPIWGVGLGNYETEISYHTRPYEARSIYSHNFLLQFTAEMGILASLFLLVSAILARKRLRPPNLKGKEIYLAVLFVLLAYNVIDIGFYFLPAGIAAVIVLSQLYPPEEEKRKLFLMPAVAAGVLCLLMGIYWVSENYRSSGDFSLGQKERVEALSYFEKSFTINPYNYKALLGYANVVFGDNRPEEAEKYLDRVLSLYPHASLPHYLKSKLALTKGYYFRAFYHAARAHRKNPLNQAYRTLYQEIKKRLEVPPGKAAP